MSLTAWLHQDGADGVKGTHKMLRQGKSGIIATLKHQIKTSVKDQGQT